MKKRLDARIGVVLISLVLILSIFAFMLLNDSAAWFAGNHKVRGDGMHVSAMNENVVEKVQFFPIESISLSGGNNIYTFSSEEITDDVKKMGVFSTLVAERQILVKITLESDVAGALIKAVSSASSYIIKDSSTIINKRENSLSSVVEFYSVSDIELTNGKYVISSDEVSNSVARFSSINESNGSVDVSFSSEITVYSTPNEETDTEIYIIIDYYEDSINYVIDHVNNLMMDGSTDIVAGETIEFACDFEILISEK